MGDEKYRIGDVEKNLEKYDVTMGRNLKGSYLEFKDGERVPIARYDISLTPDDIAAIADKITERRGGDKSLQREIANNLTKSVTHSWERGLAKKAAVVFLLCIGGMFLLFNSGTIVGFVVGGDVSSSLGLGLKIFLGCSFVGLGFFGIKRFRR